MEDEYDMEKAGYKPTGSGYKRYIIEPMFRHTTSAPPRSSNRKFIYWISGIAALFIVGFFLFNNIFVGEDADVAFSPCPQGVSTIRGIDATTENMLAKADYKGALDRIDSLEDEIATELMTLEREKDSRGAEQERHPAQDSGCILCHSGDYCRSGSDDRRHLSNE